MTDSPDSAAAQAELASAHANSTALITGFTPVPRRFNRGDVWTEEVQRAFIEWLADTGSVEGACRAVGRSPASAYRLRRHPQGAGFAAAWRAAVDFGVQRIEDYAMDRALNGVEVPVFAYGDKIATRRVYNDRLAMFMLRSRMPERYCDGGAKAMSAVDKRTLERLKKQWRAEWEKERWLLDQEEEKKTFAEIDQWLDAMQQNRWNNMSPRARAAYEEADRIAKEDGVAWMDAESEQKEDAGEIRAAEPEEPAADPEGPEEEVVVEADGDGRQDSGTAGEIRAGQAPSVRCADTSLLRPFDRLRVQDERTGGGFAVSDPPPFTGEGNHEAQRSGGGGQCTDPEHGRPSPSHLSDAPEDTP